jgi:hypothetical protein
VSVFKRLLCGCVPPEDTNPVDATLTAAQGCMSRAVHDHNSRPGAVTRFLRANVPQLSFAVVVFALVMHFTGEIRLELYNPVPQVSEGATVGYARLAGSRRLVADLVVLWRLYVLSPCECV